MSIKPILFNTEMVRAILSGRKTVTRRVVKPQPNGTFDQHWGGFYKDDEWILLKAPYRPGDILYVRETWQFGAAMDENGFYSEEWQYYYAADGDPFQIWEDGDGIEHDHMIWRPSIHMPREAARIFLRVTDVRVERLQEIDEDGAIAEGLYKGWRLTQTSTLAATARQAFMWLWQRLTRKAPVWQGWAANPWVWVIEFERCEPPKEGAV